MSDNLNILSPSFLAKYKNKQPNWGFNGLGYIVYKRTYARLKEDGTTEEWNETVERCINGAQKIDDRADDQFHTGETDILWRKVDIEGNVLDETLYKMGETPESKPKKEHYWEMVEGPNHTHKFDKEGWEKWNARKSNGFRLFGKYFEALWD